jgi:hypothetical protein
VAGHAGTLAGRFIFVNIVPTTMAMQRAIMLFKVLDKFAAFHVEND